MRCHESTWAMSTLNPVASALHPLLCRFHWHIHTMSLVILPTAPGPTLQMACALFPSTQPCQTLTHVPLTMIADTMSPSAFFSALTALDLDTLAWVMTSSMSLGSTPESSTSSLSSSAGAGHKRQEEGAGE